SSLARIAFALGDAPGTIVLLGPVGPARVHQEYLDARRALPIDENAGASLGHEASKHVATLIAGGSTPTSLAMPPRSRRIFPDAAWEARNFTTDAPQATLQGNALGKNAGETQTPRAIRERMGARRWLNIKASWSSGKTPSSRARFATAGRWRSMATSKAMSPPVPFSFIPTANATARCTRKAPKSGARCR